LGIPIFMLAAETALTDRILVGDSVSGRERRAAIAIRDHVIPFQKWGTKLFTLPYLSKYYDKTYYFTQTSRNFRDQREQFVQALNKAIAEHDQVDIFLLAHSNWYVKWIPHEPPYIGTIRLVYDCGCADASQAGLWRPYGVRSYIAHPQSGFNSVFYVYFLRRWTRGFSAADATREANSLSEHFLSAAAAITGGVSGVRNDWIYAPAQVFGDGTTTIRSAR
jgi:hypothetical protein